MSLSLNTSVESWSQGVIPQLMFVAGNNCHISKYISKLDPWVRVHKLTKHLCALDTLFDPFWKCSGHLKILCQGVVKKPWHAWHENFCVETKHSILVLDCVNVYIWVTHISLRCFHSFKPVKNIFPGIDTLSIATTADIGQCLIFQ